MNNIDPYQILDLPVESTLEEVKNAYRKLAQTHHPDKGGDADTYKIIKLAFKMVINNLKNGTPIPKTQSAQFLEMRQSAQNYVPTQKQLEPHEFLGQKQPINPNREFNRDNFNDKFIQNRNQSDDYLLNASADNDYRENRTKDQLLSEQANIDSELGKIKPMFSGKTFDPNAFNRTFEHFNGSAESRNKAMQLYEEPEALTSGMQPFTEIDEGHKVLKTDKLSTLQFSSFEDGFNGGQNPNQVDDQLLKKFSQQPNITDVNTIEEGFGTKLKQRMNDYQSLNINFHPQPEDKNKLPDSLKSTHSSVDKISQKNLNDSFSQKIADRNSLVHSLKYGNNAPPNTQNMLQNTQNSPNMPQNGQHMPQNGQHMPSHRILPVMDYPRNSNLPLDGGLGGNFPQQQLGGHGGVPKSQGNDYFAKMPVQNTPQHLQNQQMPQHLQNQQMPQFYQNQNQNQNQNLQKHIQTQFAYPATYVQPPQVAQNVNYLSNFQQNAPQPPTNDLSLIQKQLLDLQKTVLQQQITINQQNKANKKKSIKK